MTTNITNYGRPMKPFFIKIPKFWAWAYKFWCIWGIFDIILSDEPITGIDVVQAKSVFKVLFSLHHLMTKNRK